MSSSIRKGLIALHPESEGFLIALGDQPFLKTRTVNALIRVFAGEKGKIVVPFFRGRQGHPVIFSRRYENEMLALRGDTGGRAVVERHAGEVVRVRVKSDGVVKDIDTWEDYRASEGRSKSLRAAGPGKFAEGK